MNKNTTKFEVGQVVIVTVEGSYHNQAGTVATILNGGRLLGVKLYNTTSETDFAATELKAA